MSKHTTGYKIAHFVLKRRWYIIAANVLLLVIIFAGMALRGKKYGDHMNYMKVIREDPTKRVEGYKGQKAMFARARAGEVGCKAISTGDNKHPSSYPEILSAYYRTTNNLWKKLVSNPKKRAN